MKTLTRTQKQTVELFETCTDCRSTLELLGETMTFDRGVMELWRCPGCGRECLRPLKAVCNHPTASTVGACGAS